MPPHRPSVRLRRLATTLRTLRTDQGLSRREVFERTGINAATLYRIEAARVHPQLRTLTALFTLYQVPEAERRTLTELMTESERTAWLHAYTDLLPESSRTAIEFEDEAHTVHCYSSLRIPGLLQTPAYTRAVTLGTLRAGDQQAAERRVEVQIRRRAALTRTNRPLRLRVVCDEAVLCRIVGGPDVMREQLCYLTEITELPNLTFQLVPFSAGAYPGMAGNFTIMNLPNDTSAVHIENTAAGDRVLTTAADTRSCTELFTRLRKTALPPAESIDLLATDARLTARPKQTPPHDH